MFHSALGKWVDDSLLTAVDCHEDRYNKLRFFCRVGVNGYLSWCERIRIEIEVKAKLRRMNRFEIIKVEDFE